MRWIQTVFWVFIGSMLIWQFVSYNHKLDVKQAAAGPQQQQFFFNAQTMAPPPPPKPDAANVQQIAFGCTEGMPYPGQYTCHVTLQNKGNLKATNVQIMVAPYHGAWTGNPEEARSSKAHVLTSSDALYSMSQWLSFPDLAPGEKVTKDISFFDQPGLSPGNNQQPEIQFQSEKPQDAPSAPKP